MSRLSILAVLATAVTFVPAAAVAGDPSTEQAAKPRKEKKVCRRLVDTGSIMTQKTCRSRKEWQQADEQNAANARNAIDQRNRTMGTNTPQ
jgi:hypothetical protein